MFSTRLAIVKIAVKLARSKPCFEEMLFMSCSSLKTYFQQWKCNQGTFSFNSFQTSNESVFFNIRISKPRMRTSDSLISVKRNFSNVTLFSHRLSVTEVIRKDFISPICFFLLPLKEVIQF